MAESKLNARQPSPSLEASNERSQMSTPEKQIPPEPSDGSEFLHEDDFEEDEEEDEEEWDGASDDEDDPEEEWDGQPPAKQ